VTYEIDIADLRDELAEKDLRDRIDRRCNKPSPIRDFYSRL
jgi:hypothetical protein